MKNPLLHGTGTCRTIESHLQEAFPPGNRSSSCKLSPAYKSTGTVTYAPPKGKAQATQGQCSGLFQGEKSLPLSKEKTRL